MSKIIAIIPARGGSKRVPRKNIKSFVGKPIIAYSIEASLKSGIFDEVMVSTDDYEIAEISKLYGASVPFFRSKEKSDDMTMTADVLIEVLNEYEKIGINFDYVCCIYATAPFITSEKLNESMNLLINSGANSVLPIVKFSYPPQRGLVKINNYITMEKPENYNVRSQDFEPIYHDCGQFYCVKSEYLQKERKLFGDNTIPYFMKEYEVQDIDTSEDWEMAEMKYKILYSKII